MKVEFTQMGMFIYTKTTLSGGSMNKITIQQANKDNILSVYSGKPGCMCGCVGKHYYNPVYKDEGTKRRGYEVSDEETSIRMITRVLNLLRDVASDLSADESSKLVVDDNYFYARINNRDYVAYVRDGFIAGV